IVLVFGQTHPHEISDRNSNGITDLGDTKFVQQSNDFAFQLYKQVSAQASNGNVVFSPLSISACLSLAAMGAGGVTADEMFGGLRYGRADQKQQVAEWYRRLMHRLANDTSIALANKLYVREGFNVKRSFQEVATNSFQSEVEMIDFAQNKIAAKTINDWVERNTNNKIKDLIAANSLNVLTRMVLVNAMHFHAKWKHQFKRFFTKPRPFWFSDTESRDVPMMYIQEYFAYNNFVAQGFSAVELAYSDSFVKMLVLLPNNRDGLAALEERLSSLNFVDLRSKMYENFVEVYLPKFKIDFSLDLNNVLTSLGMGRMFSDAAEFPDFLHSGGPLKVSKAIHKAFIKVNEAGTEAAATTAIVLVFGQTHPREISDRNSNGITDLGDTKFVQQSNDFAFQLYKQVSAQASNGNVVFSPLSISACLSLAAMGAGGVTADEMFSGLRYGRADQKQQVAEWYRRLMHRLANDTSIALANKLYVREGFNVKRSFQEVATNSFQSEVEMIDFAQNKIAAKTINDWVERNTNNKIKDLISADSLDKLTRMVLVNAVHFKGNWRYQFETTNTRPMRFWSSQTDSRDVPMMYIQEYFAYKNFKVKGFSAVELAYSGERMSMLVLLPNKRDGIAALEQRLSRLDLVQLRREMNEIDVKVYLPKFKIDFSLDLNGVLTSLGMGRMFSDSAEFPDMLESGGPLKVSKAIHKAFIEVNEEGTEAAASTGFYMVPLSYPPPTPPPTMEFKADHPFIYVLMSQDKGVYFIGKVINPA
uniref:Serpin domain-containing protein n=1 Tax=Anopheles albimanus TaxID=7167 RepID=A0A182FCG6_ANOAL